MNNNFQLWKIFDFKVSTKVQISKKKNSHVIFPKWAIHKKLLKNFEAHVFLCIFSI